MKQLIMQILRIYVNKLGNVIIKKIHSKSVHIFNYCNSIKKQSPIIVINARNNQTFQKKIIHYNNFFKRTLK